MSHKRRIAALLCALLLFGATSRAVSHDGLYFVAVENVVLPLTDEAMPFWHNGYLYISSDVFTGNARDALGISRAKLWDGVLLYRGEQSLLFQRDYPYAQDTEQNTYAPGMVWHEDSAYVPAAVVARYFNLLYSTVDVERGKLVWLRNESFKMGDKAFAKAAAFQLNAAYQEYLRTPEPEPAPPEEPEASEETVPEAEPEAVTPEEPETAPVAPETSQEPSNPATPPPSAQASTPSTSTQNVTPSTSPQTVTPSTSPQTSAPSTSTQNVTPSPSAQTSAPSTPTQNVTPPPSAQTSAPSTPTQNATPSTSAQASAPSTPTQNVTPPPSAQASAPSTPTQNVTPPPSAQASAPSMSAQSATTESPTETAPQMRGNQRIYLCLRGDNATPTLLDALDRHDIRATVFCDETFLAEQGDLLRRMTATGYRVGLYVSAGDAAATLAQLETCNLLLQRTTMEKTRLAFLDGGGEDTLSAVRDAGFFCLRPDVNRAKSPLRTSRQAADLLKLVSQRPQAVSVWLDGTVTRAGLNAFLNGALEINDTFQPWAESASF